MNRRLLATAAVLFIASVFSSPAASQSRASPPPGAGDRNLRDDMSDVKTRSNEIERVRREGDKPGDLAASTPEQRFPQIKEDFERIQIINGEVLQARAAAGGAPDYGRIAEAASELRKRAVRLRSNLFAAGPGKQPKDKGTEAPEQQDLKSLLTALDGAIASFVSSPIFRNTKVVNTEDSAKARRALETIIKLGARVDREAAKLKKAAGAGGGR